MKFIIVHEFLNLSIFPGWFLNDLVILTTLIWHIFSHTSPNYFKNICNYKGFTYYEFKLQCWDHRRSIAHLANLSDAQEIRFVLITGIRYIVPVNCKISNLKLIRSFKFYWSTNWQESQQLFRLALSCNIAAKGISKSTKSHNTTQLWVYGERVWGLFN